MDLSREGDVGQCGVRGGAHSTADTKDVGTGYSGPQVARTVESVPPLNRGHGIEAGGVNELLHNSGAAIAARLPGGFPTTRRHGAKEKFVFVFLI